MKDLDAKNTSFEDSKELIKNAIESGDSEAYAQAHIDFAKAIESKILQEAKAMSNIGYDSDIMVQRGLKPLTSDETKYYNKIIDGIDLDEMTELMPVTVIDRVFEDLEQNYPLLREVGFHNTTGVTQWITRTSESEAAWWGELTDEIKKKLKASFRIEDTGLFKLSSYVPLHKPMLDLGPVWLDRFVRAILAESIYIALETAMIKGTGKNEPIGMLKDLDAPVVAGAYADKAAKPLNDLRPATLGKEIMAPLTKDGKRAVSNVLLIVNPVDYWEKLFGATTFMSSEGLYVHGVMPIPVTIIQSAFMPKGKLIAGLGKDYFMGVGSSRKVEFSDQYRFLEDQRVYVTKQYANGKPIDNDSFLVFDIKDIVADNLFEA